MYKYNTFKNALYSLKITFFIVLAFYITLIPVAILFGVYEPFLHTGIVIIFLSITFLIQLGFHFFNGKYHLMKSDKYYKILRMISIICFFIPLGGVTIFFFILFPLSFYNKEN